MRVLRAADSPSRPRGGVNLAMGLGADQLRAHGVETDLLFSDELWSDGLWSGRRAQRLRRLVTPWRLVAEVRRRQRAGVALDAVELHEPLAGVYALMRPVLRLPPMVVFSHGLEAASWQAERERWTVVGKPAGALLSCLSVPLTRLVPIAFGMRRAAAVTVLNQGDRSFAIRHLGVAPGRITVVHNGAAPEFHAVERTGARVVPRVVFLGSWIDRKGVPELTEATAELVARGVAFELVVLGTRVPDEVLIQDFAESSRACVTPCADFPREELPGLLAEADVLVVPSWFEGMPLTMLEAAAAGLACVATDLAAHREVYPGGEQDGALLVPVHDGPALAAALGALLTDPVRLHRAQEAARRTGSRFTWSRSAEQLAAVYRTVVDAG